MTVLLSLGLLASSTPLLAGSIQDVPPAVEGRRWTLDDILAVPEATDLVLARDGKTVFFVLKTNDMAGNKERYTLYRYERGGHAATALLSADLIEQLVRDPGSDGVTALLDLGEGLQLYRIDTSGKPSLLVAQKDTVLFATACGGLAKMWYKAPRKVGVLSYSWSPDGRYLWYEAMRPEAASPVLADQAVLEQAWYPCQTGRAAIELHLRSSMGDDHLVAVRPIRDRIASAFNGAVRWMGTHLHYQEELDNPAGPLRLASFDYDLQTFRSTSIAKPADTGIAVSPGPAGGILGTVGYGASRRLVERGGREGDHDYGPALFSLGDPRTAGNWLSPDGKTVIVGTRYFDRPRFGLEWLSRTARHAIGGDESFMKCDFQPDLAFGFCIREGITKPPELVEVEPGSARISHALFLSPRHQEIAPLKVVARTWSSHLGDETSGFVMLPRGYVPGRRYPMIVVTHAGDADQRFAAAEFQWNYPIQLFAEEGFVVMAINDPSPAWSEVLSRAIAAWGGEKNGTSPLQVRQQVWLNGAVAIEDAVRELVQEGLADPARLGIAGYSRGSQMAQVTMTQSHLFRAVSSGDGDVLDPSSWWDGRPDYLSVFGGSPYDASVSAYRELSPHLRAAQVSAAVLQQMAVPRQGALLLHRQLVAAGVPAEIVVYPGETPDSSETHMFHIPSNKKRAMLENLAWFDVWLKGTVPPDAPSSEQTEKWLGMSKALPIATSVRP